jgi:hypothetical protein
VDVVDAGGSASDLTERGDLEGRVCLPPNDLDREGAAAEQADVEVMFGPGQLEAPDNLQEGAAVVGAAEQDKVRIKFSGRDLAEVGNACRGLNMTLWNYRDVPGPTRYAFPLTAAGLG